ncbi:uncharacterized protein LOC116343928 [Contarinia nasturtii]|uniref:uncharacterized protein LOC116343928 n=1 Tax=Contarinia nasturtii TaxID=265458 RepID=UPI0012D3AB04|nr:uncharacterized protein LOC116343928 [Contarinia nasturtii]XP_031628117.1 uncharacterized protein LOC116343928 [Contarinia nasturtii]
MAQRSSLTFNFEVLFVSELKVFYSPKHLLNGIPWQIKLQQYDYEKEPWLMAILCCRYKADSTWSYSARATIKLFRMVDDKEKVIERRITPYVFQPDLKLHYARVYLIPWRHLLDKSKGYVKDNIISVGVKIEMADPNEQIRSHLILKDTYKSCTDACIKKFQVSVGNVMNLMAVRSPSFIMRNVFWHILIFKDSKKLKFSLCHDDTLLQFPWEITSSIKILSASASVMSIQRKKVENRNDIYKPFFELVWTELIESANEFINNNTIVIDVQMSTLKTNKAIILSNPLIIKHPEKRKGTCIEKPAKRYELMCPICLERFEEQNISITKCGHLFCSECLNTAMKSRRICPVCNNRVISTQVKRAHLPFAT